MTTKYRERLELVFKDVPLAQFGNAMPVIRKLGNGENAKIVLSGNGRYLVAPPVRKKSTRIKPT